MTDLITVEEAGKLAHKYRFANNDLERVLCETARTVIALRDQLADAEAAMAAVVERAVAHGDAWLKAFGDVEIKYTPANAHASDAVMDYQDAIRALAHPSGLAMLAELRAERDAAIGDRTMARAGREIAIADRDELRAAIFGSPDYAADLRNGNFREMAETLHSAQKGGVARAEAAEAERDALAAANAALEARVAGLVEAAEDAEYDLLQWLECSKSLTAAGFNMDGTADVTAKLTAALSHIKRGKTNG